MATLKRGDRVRIHGLNARPELNDTHGTILSFHEDKGRFAVMLETTKEKILLKPANLTGVAPEPKKADAPRRTFAPPLPRTGGEWDDLGEQQLMLALSDAERAVASKPQRTALIDALTYGIRRDRMTVFANPPRYDRLALRTREGDGRAYYMIEAGLDAFDGRGWWTTVEWTVEEIAEQQLVAIDAETLVNEYAGVLAFLEGCRRVGRPRYAMRTDLDPNAQPHVLLVVEKLLAGSSLSFVLSEDALERAHGHGAHADSYADSSVDDGTPKMGKKELARRIQPEKG